MSEIRLARQSNMELLRIVAMLMVMVLHTGYASFGYPRTVWLQAEPLRWLGLTMTEVYTVACVNIFVLITGWFGTTFRTKGAVRLAIQPIYVTLVLALYVWLAGLPLPTGVMGYVRPIWNYWFVCSYLVLYLLTPMLNAFVEKSDEAALRRFLLVFYVITIPCSFVFADLQKGYSAVSFVGLYLLGRYLRLYGAARLQHWPRWRFMALYVVLMGTMGLVGWGAGMMSQTFMGTFVPFVVAYTNPITIVAAGAMLLFFSRVRLQSRLVNWLASGSFAAYLVHQNILVRKEYYAYIRHLADVIPSTPLFMLAVLVSIVAIYVISTLAIQVVIRMVK